MLALLASIACLALNAFFVAAEFAIVKVRITQLRRRVRRGERRAVAAEAVLSRLDRYLSVTQVGITIASLGLGWIGEPAMERAGDHVAVLLTGAPLGSVGHVAVSAFGLALLTFLHVLVGELVPKAIAIRHSESTALFASLPLRFADRLFRPALWILERAQTAVLRALDVDPEMTEGSLSEEEIVGILAANASRGSRRAADKQRTIERVLRFAARPVRSIMVPRVDVVALPIDTPGEHALSILRKHEFSRVPLYEHSIDSISGYLYAKDFLFDDSARTRPNLRGLERPTLYVPESTDGLGVLREMQRSRVPIAIIVDEYGGTSGIVTFEDLVEEVFGDIRDELDAERDKVVAQGDAWEVDPRATIDDLREAGVPIDEHAPSEPIGKLVLDRLGHLPHVGDVAPVCDGVVARIIAISKRRIERLRVSMG
jgi:CBS domain containing-hemolysin-like protein